MSYLIKRAMPEDANEILQFIKTIGGETDNLTFGHEGLPISVEDEQTYIRSLNESASSTMLVARKNGIIVGNANLCGMPQQRMKHRGEFSISILKSEWGNGLGSMLLEEIVAFAKNVAQIEIISLEVRSDNKRAIGLYKKYGFKKFGQFKGYFKIDGKYVDFDLMSLNNLDER